MIKEQYISFEIAKLLKEKGFKEETYGNYYLGGKFDGEFEESSKVNWNKFFKTPIAAPTQQMAMRWLREVHQLFIDIRYSIICHKFRYSIWTNESKNHDDGCFVDFIYPTYEAAVEAAIKYCLENLVK